MSTISSQGIFAIDLGHPKPSSEICRGSGTVQLRVHGQGTAFYNTQDLIRPYISESSRNYPCPECAGQMPYERLEVARQEIIADSRYMGEVGFIKHSLAHDLAQHMLE
jgi:hypothetical protein